MRYNRCHFTWMSRKFQGRKLTMKYPFRKLKKRQGWEARGRSVKRHLLEGWRDSKIPLRDEMAAGHPESQEAASLSPPATAPSSSTAQSGQETASGEAESRAPTPSLMPDGNELDGTMRPIILSSGREDRTSIVTVAVHLLCLIATPWVSSILFLPTLCFG